VGETGTTHSKSLFVPSMTVEAATGANLSDTPSRAREGLVEQAPREGSPLRYAGNAEGGSRTYRRRPRRETGECKTSSGAVV